jgi:hypothetical protein
MALRGIAGGVVTDGSRYVVPSGLPMNPPQRWQ